MKIVVGFLRSPEGRVAVDRAIDEAELRDAELDVVHTARDHVNEVMAYQRESEEVEHRLETDGVTFSMREYERGHSPSEDVPEAVADDRADVVVIGLRRRSPVSKLLLRSNAREIPLKANCAALAVKVFDDGE